MLKFVDDKGVETYMEITYVNKAKGSCKAYITEVQDEEVAYSHYGHAIDTTQTPIWCSDCEVDVGVVATQKGIEKYKERQDKTFLDGTILPEEEEDVIS